MSYDPIHSKILVAAGAMLMSLNHRGSDPWPDQIMEGRDGPELHTYIVDPRLRGEDTGGRFTQPGLSLAVEAVRDLVAGGLSVRKACETVARQINNYWSQAWMRWAERSDDLERLNGPTLAERLRRAYYDSRS
jgi:uncharacterized protein YoaH (UPF0181 family)